MFALEGYISPLGKDFFNFFSKKMFLFFASSEELLEHTTESYVRRLKGYKKILLFLIPEAATTLPCATMPGGLLL